MLENQRKLHLQNKYYEDMEKGIEAIMETLLKKDPAFKFDRDCAYGKRIWLVDIDPMWPECKDYMG